MCEEGEGTRVRGGGGHMCEEGEGTCVRGGQGHVMTF